MGKFRKHFHALVGALVLCLSLTTAIAETYPGYTTQNLNVRVAPGGEGKIVAHLDTDEDVLVIGEEQARGRDGCSSRSRKTEKPFRVMY